MHGNSNNSQNLFEESVTDVIELCDDKDDTATEFEVAMDNNKAINIMALTPAPALHLALPRSLEKSSVIEESSMDRSLF